MVPPEEQDWRPLFAPSEFFTQFGHYLALDVMSPSAAVHESWLGFVESKVGAERREGGGGGSWWHVSRLPCFPAAQPCPVAVFMSPSAASPTPKLHHPSALGPPSPSPLDHHSPASSFGGGAGKGPRAQRNLFVPPGVQALTGAHPRHRPACRWGAADCGRGRVRAWANCWLARVPASATLVGRVRG